jgi:hypothetical protein
VIDRSEWSRCFAKQAKADYATYEHLKHTETVPECHRLQFLQMACEKLSKAHLCHAGSEPRQLEKSHAYIATVLPVILRLQYGRMTGRALKDRSDIIKQISHLARQIELLAPSVGDATRRPDNCEYPWEDQGILFVPAEYTFPNLSLLRQPAGTLLQTLLPRAIEELNPSPSTDHVP